MPGCDRSGSGTRRAAWLWFFLTVVLGGVLRASGVIRWGESGQVGQAAWRQLCKNSRGSRNSYSLWRCSWPWCSSGSTSGNRSEVGPERSRACPLGNRRQSGSGSAQWHSRRPRRGGPSPRDRRRSLAVVDRQGRHPVVPEQNARPLSPAPGSAFATCSEIPEGDGLPSWPTRSSDSLGVCGGRRDGGGPCDLPMIYPSLMGGCRSRQRRRDHASQAK